MTACAAVKDAGLLCVIQALEVHQKQFLISGNPEHLAPSVPCLQETYLPNNPVCTDTGSRETGPHIPQVICSVLALLDCYVGQTLIIPRQQIACNTAYLNKLMIFLDQCLNASPPREEANVHQPKPVQPS